ncbi:Epi-isozizaene 5-monooxygenase/(E)-beta-farnesene synthase [Enhygromyxa salina]|uniref:Epi-isozizaene 5-monooxygenase/(E)-beta-farnesene synthase n=1 Tax=Enhygromyxa salina TaxID=215803 RepID=A0A2S9YK04_9BACT|nr:cytochrome P450 [Enhygromyxa salina]PRQ05414.1 Epi-isozizaene 5-monooxygenase/(E)-beta-farnesene synthase [Enhygromyxa salina]
MEPAEAAKHLWPSTPAWPVIGHLPGMISLGLVPFIESVWRELGDCFEFRAGAETIKVIVHPDDVEAMLLRRRHKYTKGASYDQFRRLVGRGLISSEGALWRRQRRLIQPSFNRDTITALGQGMVAQVDVMLERWAAADPGGGVIDIHAELMRLTLEITGEALFGLRFAEDRASISTREFSDALGVVAARITAPLEAPRWLPTPGNIKLERAIASLDRVVMRIINERRQGGEDHDDLLGALLRGSDERGDALDDELLRDEVLTMFLAGHETTAVSLGWALWQLREQPEVRARMLETIDAAVGQRGPTSADLPALAYIKQVFYESMRLISPVWTGARNCVEPDVLGEGYAVEPGTRVMNFIWLTHRHPEFWDQPERFDPERFAPEAIAKQHKFAYLPFTHGPRKCVGEHFATLESVLVLTRLFQRVELEAVPDFEPEMDFQLTTRPRNGLMMRWRPRARVAG